MLFLGSENHCFEGQNSSNEIIDNNTMTIKYEVAPDVPQRYSFLESRRACGKKIAMYWKTIVRRSEVRKPDKNGKLAGRRQTMARSFCRFDLSKLHVSCCRNATKKDDGQWLAWLKKMVSSYVSC